MTVAMLEKPVALDLGLDEEMRLERELVRLLREQMVLQTQLRVSPVDPSVARRIQARLCTLDAGIEERRVELAGAIRARRTSCRAPMRARAA